MWILQESSEPAQRDPFGYGIAITVLGIAIVVERLIRGKPLTKIRMGSAIAIILLGAGISFGFLGQLLKPILELVKRFIG